MFSRRAGFRFNRGRVAVGIPAPGGGGGDTDPPGVSGNLVIAADGLSGVITLDEDCDETSVPAAGDFGLSGTPVLVDGVSYTDATHIELTFDSPILASEIVTWDYTAGANPIQDLAGNDLPNVSGGATTNGSGIEAETVVAQYTASWSIADTEYMPRRPVSGLTWGAGGGGDVDAVTPDLATGGAGELRIWSIASALPGGISGTCGAPGAAGALGSATAGGDSTVTDASGLLVTAKGGGPGNSLTNTAGAGGTGGSGGTGRNGGNGLTAASGNTFGGATSGSSTAASGTTPGEPEGAPGNRGKVFAGAGGSCVSTTAQNGGVGKTVVVYQRAVAIGSRPFDAGRAWGRDTANATARNVSFGGSHVANDRLVVNASCASASAAGMSMTGYTEKHETLNGGTGATYVRDGDGSDPVAIATTLSGRVSWQTRRVRGAAAVTNISVGTATGNTQPDPPSLDHGSVVDALWLGCLTTGGSNVGLGEPAIPSGYTGFCLPPSATTIIGALVVCTRPLLATQTEDPGEITLEATSTPYVTWTACIPK